MPLPGPAANQTRQPALLVRMHALGKRRKGQKHPIIPKYKERYYKREKVRLMTCFARDQRFETYFYEVGVRNGKTVKHDV
jgi:hypothetical protein